MDKLKKLITIISLLVIIVAIYLYSSTKVEHLSFSGIIETTKVNVNAKTYGQLAKLKVQEGDKLNKNQVIAVLERNDIIAQTQAQEALVKVAQANLQDLKNGLRPEEIAEIKWQLAETEATMGKASNDLLRYHALYNENAIPISVLEQYENNFIVAQNQYKSFQEKYKLALAGAREEQINIALNQVEQNQAQLLNAKVKEDETLVKSPLYGVVIDKNYNNGEYVTTGAQVLTVADLNDLWIRIYISTNDIGKIYLGQVVKIKVDAFPQEIFQGEIKEIADEAEYTPKFVQTKDERASLVYGVKVQITTSNHNLKPGMPADVEI